MCVGVGWGPAQALGIVGDPSASNSRPRAHLAMGDSHGASWSIWFLFLWLTRVLYFRDGGFVPSTAAHAHRDTPAQTSNCWWQGSGVGLTVDEGRGVDVDDTARHCE